METLIERAQNARRRAYAPYSGYTVGCALRTTSGAVFEGVNVENVSYGATICAERAAIVAMVTAGERGIREIAVASKDGGNVCGLCLQVIQEFAADPANLEIALANEGGESLRVRLSQVFPAGFVSAEVGRTE
jgi:cytidine deaminase